MVSALRKEEGRRERGFLSIERLIRIVERQLIYVLLIHIRTEDICIDNPRVLYLNQTIVGCLPAVALLVVYHHANRPSGKNGVEAAEMRIAANLHTGLEAAERGTVVWEKLATIDVISFVLKRGVSFRANKGHVGEHACCVRRNGCTISAVIRLKAVGLADVSQARVANR